MRSGPACCPVSAKSVPVVSAGDTLHVSWRSMSPSSIPRLICMIVRPVVVSPLRRACCIGAAHRYFGRREVWTLRKPIGGISSRIWGRIFPYATTIQISGASSRTVARKSSFFTFSGWNSGIFFSCAIFATGEEIISCHRQPILSGLVMTQIISSTSSRVVK